MRSIKPGRGTSAMGTAAAIIMVAFGILWTIFAYAITRDAPIPVVGIIFPLAGVLFVIFGIISVAYNLYNTTNKNRLSLLDITPPGGEPDPLNQLFGSPSGSQPSSAPTPPQSVELRLSKLQDLHTQGLISDTEYASQRERILRSI